MEVRDIIHGAIVLSAEEVALIESKFFQRLQRIKQMGFSEFSFPSATHNRFIHSLGAIYVASHVYRTIFSRELKLKNKSAFDRLHAVTRLGALLHDIGHGPLSHTTEFAMPPVKDLGIPGLSQKVSRKATHEDYTLKILLDSSLTPILERAGKRWGFTPRHVASLVCHEIDIKDDFFIEQTDGARVDFQPILRQIISSELDADRMDYLRRDSLHSGVSYGQFDFDWLSANLTFHIRSGRCYLGLQHRALYTFEDFLISRYHMFLMVYFHHKSVVYEEMLAKYFSSPDCGYSLPSDIEAYASCDDYHLYTHLKQSENVWAKRVSEKRPFQVLIELHSGIPATKVAAGEQKQLLTKVEQELKTKKISYLKAQTTGELSKYSGKPTDPIFVRYDNSYSEPAYIPIQECTDLFLRYSENRSITRLYVSPEDFQRIKSAGRAGPLKYRD